MSIAKSRQLALTHQGFHSAKLAILLFLAFQLSPPGFAGEPTGWTTGNKSILIIPVGFTDAPAPAGPAEGWSNLMVQVNLYYQHQSYGKYGITNATICPVINMGVSYTTYNSYIPWKTSPFLPAVRTKAKLAGYDTDNYDLEIVHTWIPTVDSGVGASAVHGGKGAFFNYSNTAEKISMSAPHELGHNLGAFHTRGAGSSTYLPGTEMAQSTKTEYWLAEYGSYFDLMGASDYNSSGIGEFCAYYKNLFGWIPDNMVLSPATSGVYRIHPHDQGSLIPGNMYAMKVWIDSNYTYWCSFRQAVTGNVWSMHGLEVYWGGESVMNSGRVPYELDMTPGSRGTADPGARRASISNMGDAPLALGRTFSDSNRNLHITPVREGGTSPESLDVALNFGPFPGNRAPVISISATSLTPATNQLVNFTATASDPDGDTLAYYWEFDDPAAPASADVSPFGKGILNPDTTLRTNAVYSWVSNSLCQVRCTATDMKGGATTASLLVTVGSGGGLIISGVVKDEFGSPVAGAVVNNNWGSYGTWFYDTNFIGSSQTASNGQYMLRVRPGTTNKITAHYNGHAFICNTPGGSTTGTVIIAGSSALNVNFTRTNVLRTIGGPVYLAGAFPGYDPAIHGAMTVHDGTPAHDALVNSNGYWFMNVPEGPVYLTFTTQPGYTVNYGFRNPYEVIATHSNLALFVDVSNAVSSVSFASSSGSGDGTAGTVNIPIILKVPAGYTNASWGMNVWYNGDVDGASTAQYGTDYRLLGQEMEFKNSSTIFTNNIAMRLFTNGTPNSRTVVVKLNPNSFTAHLGDITTYTYAIIPPGADKDSDGMPDDWEWRFANSLTNLLPSADDDHDGRPNYDEYEADTSPVDSNSVLAITDFQNQTGNVRIGWKGGSSARQYLEYKQNLTDGAESWTPIYTNLPPTPLATNSLCPDIPGTSKFYRIRAER